MTDIDELHTSMLALIPDTYKKNPGYPAWDITRALSLGVVSLNEDCAAVLAHMNVYNLSGDELDTYIMQHRGLTRKYGSPAETELTVVSGNGSIAAGDLFATASGVQFYATEDVDEVTAGDTFHVRAVNEGVVGNVPADSIIYMPVTVAGIASVTNAADAVGGTDTETDTDFLDRFIFDLQNPANGANQASYIAWATSIAGVGRAKVFPRANGDNTVEVCITSGAMGVPSSTLVDAVQEYIDPNENGDGAGAAPIGAQCTVTACTTLAINISMLLTIEPGGVHDTVVDAIKENLTAYFKTLAFVQSYVSYAQVSNVIHDTPGVYDFASLQVNGGVVNVNLGERQVPALGTVTA